MTDSTLSSELRALATKLLEQAAKLEANDRDLWIPPRQMLAEITDNPDDGWVIRTVKAGADFNNEYPYTVVPYGQKWRQCRPLQDPLVLQFRPHTPDDPPPVGDYEYVIVVRRSGIIEGGESIDLEWDLDSENPETEIIGWLPQGAKW